MHEGSEGGSGAPVTEKHEVALPKGGSLHLLRFPGDPKGPPVLMIHGAIENGRIFWSSSGKGLAPYLARRGFDVYVADLRGRGLSKPSIDRHSRFGQTEAITEELPALFETVASLHGPAPINLVAHSWGGVLLSASLARFPEKRSLAGRAVYFGSKRRVTAFNAEILLKVRLIWSLLCPIVTLYFGYLPARRLGIGSDSETGRSLAQCVRWVRERAWVDPADGFDYAAALRASPPPPTLFVAGRGDGALGHPDDALTFMREAGGRGSAYWLLSKAGGRAKDYGHIDMLTDPGAAADHFPLVEAWLRGGDAAPEGALPWSPGASTGKGAGRTAGGEGR